MQTPVLSISSSNVIFISHQVYFYSECFKIVVSNWKIAMESSFVYRMGETTCRSLWGSFMDFLSELQILLSVFIYTSIHVDWLASCHLRQCICIKSCFYCLLLLVGSRTHLLCKSTLAFKMGLLSDRGLVLLTYISVHRCGVETSVDYVYA